MLEKGVHTDTNSDSENRSFEESLLLAIERNFMDLAQLIVLKSSDRLSEALFLAMEKDMHELAMSMVLKGFDCNSLNEVWLLDDTS